MRLITDLRDATAAIRRGVAICSERLETGRWCPRPAVGAVVIRERSEPRCPTHLPVGAAKVCRGCSQLNPTADPWMCGGCRDVA